MVLSEIQPLLLLRNQPPSPLSAKYEIEMEGGTLKHTASGGSGDEEVAGNHDTTTARSSSVDEPPPLPGINTHPQQPHHHNNEEQDESTTAAYHDKSQLLQTPSQYYTTHHHHPPQDSALRDFAHLATTPGLTPHHGSSVGGVGRNIFTQQPHPSSSQSTTPHQSILKPSTYGQSSVKNAPSSSSTLNNTDNDTAASNTLVGLSTMGLLRGENALMPTPVVRRGEGATSNAANTTNIANDDPAAASTPYAPPPQQQQEYNLFQPGIHYHQGMVPQSEMKSVAELKARGVTKKGYWRDDTANSGGGGGGGVLNYEQKEERAVDTMNTTQTNRMSNEATSTESNPQSNPTPTTSPPPPQQPPMLNEFPFLFDGYAGWVCRHCSHIPYYYRGPNYVWKNPQPPPNYFVDHHLMFCPGLNVGIGRNVEGLLKSQQQQQQQVQGGSGGGGRMVVGTPEGRSVNWNSGSGLLKQQQQRKLDPPTGRSPKPGAVDGGSVVKKKKRRQSNEEEEEDREEGTTMSLPTPMLPNTATKDQAFWSSQWNSFQQQQPYHHHHPSSATATPTSTSQLMPPGYSPPAASYSQQQFVPHPPSQSLQPSGSSTLKRKSPKRRIATTSTTAENEPRSHSKQKERPTRRPYQHKSPAGIPSNDQRYKEAYQLLSTAADKIPKANSQSNSDIGTSLVKVEDTELLTDYFYYMMMQLVVCRFSERDKKTRGGKRDNIAIGYGGLQCIHCSTNDYSRKFYWSTVDRLANSFAEIPAHVLKCKSCPVEVRDALLVLKDRHSTQMASRPRGSQKVFFRRVWRRLHSGDIDAAAAENASTATSSNSSAIGTVQQPSSLLLGGFASSPQLATCVNVESALKSPEIASGTAAKLLKASMDISSPEKERRVVLALPQDKDWLSDMDCFVRNNIEIFSATTNDVNVAKEDKKYPIKLGQVGLRCVHCASSENGARREAVMYPYSVSGIYESVRDFQKLHLDYCPHLPHELRMAMGKLTHGCSSLSSVLRRYYVQAARALGLFDSEDGGIRAGGTVIPMISSGFTIGEASNSRKRGSSSQQVDEEEGGRMMMTPGQSVKRQKVTRTEEV